MLKIYFVGMSVSVLIYLASPEQARFFVFVFSLILSSGFYLAQTKKVRQKDQFLKDKEDFFAIAAHELKNPITCLLLRAGLLKRSVLCDNKEGSVKQAEGLVSDIRLLVRLIDNILDSTKIKNDKFSLDRAFVDLSVLLKESVDRLHAHAENAKVSLHLDIEPNVKGYWDQLRIEQVIVNLLSNAIKYGDGKPVNIRLRKKNHEAVLEIIDNGIGIDGKIKNLVFRKFERLVDENHSSGLGLGLYICQKIVQAHDGKIEVDSKPAHGSNFRVILPTGSSQI
jgi:signal transduction histidine kinase